MSCPYKDALGIPGKGSHTHFFGIAIIDVIMTIVGAFVLSYLFKWNFIYTMIILFVLGIIAHRLFCVRTTIDKLLFKC
jgi:hypothetical protein